MRTCIVSNRGQTCCHLFSLILTLMFPAQAMPTDNEVESDLPTSSSDQVQVWDKGTLDSGTGMK